MLKALLVKVLPLILAALAIYWCVTDPAGFTATLSTILRKILTTGGSWLKAIATWLADNLPDGK